jgi:hypothetical protein
MRKLLAVIVFVFCAACGDSTEGSAIDSSLLGVYTIDDYVMNLDGCDEATEPTPPPATRLVLYAYNQESSDEVHLAGSFCASVKSCRDVADAVLTPLMGYSFIERDDDGDWTGFAFAGGAPYNGEGFGLVQEHMLIRTADGIRAQTKTRTLNGQRCIELVVLEGTFEAELQS